MLYHIFLGLCTIFNAQQLAVKIETTQHCHQNNWSLTSAYDHVPPYHSSSTHPSFTWINISSPELKDLHCNYHTQHGSLMPNTTLYDKPSSKPQDCSHNKKKGLIVGFSVGALCAGWLVSTFLQHTRPALTIDNLDEPIVNFDKIELLGNVINKYEKLQEAEKNSQQGEPKKYQIEYNNLLLKCKDLKVHNQTLQNQYNTLKNNYNTIKTKHVELEKIIDNQNKSMHKTNKEINKMAKHHKKLQKQKTVLSKEHNNLKNTYQKLHTRHQELTSEVDHLKNTYEEEKSIYEQKSTQENKKLSNQYNQAKHTIHQLKKQKKEWIIQEKQLNNEKEALKQKYNEMLVYYQKQLIEVLQKQNEDHSIFQDTQKNLNTALNKAYHNINDIKKKKKRIEKENELLQKQSAQMFGALQTQTEIAHNAILSNPILNPPINAQVIQVPINMLPSNPNPSQKLPTQDTLITTNDNHQL